MPDHQPQRKSTLRIPGLPTSRATIVPSDLGHGYVEWSYPFKPFQIECERRFRTLSIRGGVLLDQLGVQREILFHFRLIRGPFMVDTNHFGQLFANAQRLRCFNAMQWCMKT